MNALPVASCFPDCPAMGGDHFTDKTQADPKTGALAGTVAEKIIEHLVFVFVRYARPVVAKIETNSSFGKFSNHGNLHA